MPDFTFDAVTQDHKAQSGQISAASAAAALAELESRGLTVRSLQQTEHEEPPSDMPPRLSVQPSEESHSIDASDNQFLRERIAATLEKREILAPALQAFAGEMPRGRRRRELSHLAARLRSGITVDEICQDKLLTTAWLPLLGGTSSLGSSSLLSDLFAESSRENATRRQWARLFAYPLFILGAALAVLVFLCIMVVPTFSDIFIDFELVLPELTELLVWFSRLVLYHPLRLLLISLGSLITVYMLFRLLRVLKFPGRVLRALTKGNSHQLTVMATFLRRLAESLNTGFPLPSALRLAGQSSGTPWLQRAAIALAHDFETDSADGDPSGCPAGLPPTVFYALRAGANGEPNVRLLQEMAEIYAERVRNRLNCSTSLMPQVSLLVVGCVVAVVVTALFVPLVSLVSNLSG